MKLNKLAMRTNVEDVQPGAMTKENNIAFDDKIATKKCNQHKRIHRKLQRAATTVTEAGLNNFDSAAIPTVIRYANPFVTKRTEDIPPTEEVENATMGKRNENAYMMVSRTADILKKQKEKIARQTYKYKRPQYKDAVSNALAEQRKRNNEKLVLKKKKRVAILSQSDVTDIGPETAKNGSSPFTQPDSISTKSSLCNTSVVKKISGKEIAQRSDGEIRRRKYKLRY